MAPFNPEAYKSKERKLSAKKKVVMGSRYKCEILDDDFSRDDLSGDENIGIGGDEDEYEEGGAKGVVFDDEDLFGDKKSKPMLLDELGNNFAETDQSMR